METVQEIAIIAILFILFFGVGSACYSWGYDTANNENRGKPVQKSILIVKNVMGETIPARQMVYATGVENSYVTVDFIPSDMPVIGFTIDEIPNGSYGRVLMRQE
jgi:hypothetical protein